MDTSQLIDVVTDQTNTVCMTLLDFSFIFVCLCFTLEQFTMKTNQLLNQLVHISNTTCSGYIINHVQFKHFYFNHTDRLWPLWQLSHVLTKKIFSTWVIAYSNIMTKYIKALTRGSSELCCGEISYPEHLPWFSK
jgi:hypothetical protein